MLDETRGGVDGLQTTLRLGVRTSHTPPEVPAEGPGETVALVTPLVGVK